MTCYANQDGVLYLPWKPRAVLGLAHDQICISTGQSAVFMVSLVPRASPLRVTGSERGTLGNRGSSRILSWRNLEKFNFPRTQG